jgi:nucleoid-associated protein YgaU
MGLFDFITGAGEKVFDEAPAPTVADAQAAIARTKAKRLTERVEKKGLEVEGLAIEVVGDTAKVRGKAKDQETREKVVLAIGNVLGIARVEDLMQAPPAEAATFYTVQKGDTLGKIAKEQYGNAGKYPVIFEANRPLLSDPDKIYPGQVLRIPKLGA